MTGGIGYYVHHQGDGHRQRALRIVRALARPCTLIGTFSGGLAWDGPVLDLPDDRLADGFDGQDHAPNRPLSLHYAPLGHAGVRARMAAIAAWIERTAPSLVVVDVSVEVAWLARLLSVPTVFVRLAGTRTDPPHLEAFRAAEALIAPFPEALDAPDLPDWVRAKTIHAGFLAAPAREDRDRSRRAKARRSVGADAPDRERPENRDFRTKGCAEDGRIVVVFGRGGAGGDRARLVAAARAVPDRAWHVLGPVAASDDGLPPNLHLHGWVEDVGPYLAPAALVVGAGGDGLLAAVAAAGKRFVCLPEPRAFDEQTLKAAALARLGAAVVPQDWPAARDWPALVARGLSLDPTILAGLHDPDAVARVAGVIDAIAQEIEARSRA